MISYVNNRKKNHDWKSMNMSWKLIPYGKKSIDDFTSWHTHALDKEFLIFYLFYTWPIQMVAWYQIVNCLLCVLHLSATADEIH